MEVCEVKLNHKKRKKAVSDWLWR